MKTDKVNLTVLDFPEEWGGNLMDFAVHKVKELHSRPLIIPLVHFRHRVQVVTHPGRNSRHIPGLTSHGGNAHTDTMCVEQLEHLLREIHLPGQGSPHELSAMLRSVLIKSH